MNALVYGHRLRLALEAYMSMRGFDMHGPNVTRVLDDICTDLEIEIDRYIKCQQAGELND